MSAYWTIAKGWSFCYYIYNLQFWCKTEWKTHHINVNFSTLFIEPFRLLQIYSCKRIEFEKSLISSDNHYKITMTSVISVNFICLFISLSVWTNNTKKDGYFINPSELFMTSRSAASMLQKIEKHSKHSIQQFSSIPIVIQLLGWIQINFFPKIFYSLLPWLPHKFFDVPPVWRFTGNEIFECYFRWIQLTCYLAHTILGMTRLAALLVMYLIWIYSNANIIVHLFWDIAWLFLVLFIIFISSAQAVPM